ncbi:MAG: hypothetical protein KC646_01735 [Candidatus Cloacimonetes bacterium]|nr:hypothetical protein [Candidatus Cloacimonadota bacterium]
MSVSKLMTAVVDSMRARTAIIDAVNNESGSNNPDVVKAPLTLKATTPLGPSGVNIDFKS